MNRFITICDNCGIEVEDGDQTDGQWYYVAEDVGPNGDRRVWDFCSIVCLLAFMLDVESREA